MKVVERWDEKGNPIFEVGSKRIFFDTDLLRRLVQRNISIVNLDEQFILGRAWRGGFIGLNFLEIVRGERKNNLIKKEIVKTLAHEVRHILQPRGGPIDNFVRRSVLYLNKYFPELFVLCTGIGLISAIFHFF